MVGLDFVRVFRNLSIKKEFFLGPGEVLASRIMFVLEKFGFQKFFGLEKGFLVLEKLFEFW